MNFGNLAMPRAGDLDAAIGFPSFANRVVVAFTRGRSPSHPPPRQNHVSLPEAWRRRVLLRSAMRRALLAKLSWSRSIARRAPLWVAGGVRSPRPSDAWSFFTA